MPARTTRRSLLLLRNLGDHGFGRQHQRRDRRRVLQRRTGHLGRIDDAGLHQILITARCGVEAVVGVVVRANLLDDDRAFVTGIADDLANRLFAGARDDVDANLLVAFALEVVQSTSAARSSATPPPGTMPSSTAARVACRASSTRAFFSFISVSVAAPTLMTATPPASFARRSWSFSRS